MIDRENNEKGMIDLGVYFTRYIKRIPSKYWRGIERGEWFDNSVDVNNPKTKEEIEIIENIRKNIETEFILDFDGGVIGIKNKNAVEKAIDIVKAQSPYTKWNGYRLLLPEGFWDSWIASYDNKPIYYYLKDKMV